MKFTAYFTEDAIQLNLQGESDHERELLRLLKECKGPIKMHHGVNVTDIGRCMGHYLRAWERDEEKFTCLTIERQAPGFDHALWDLEIGHFLRRVYTELKIPDHKGELETARPEQIRLLAIFTEASRLLAVAVEAGILPRSDCGPDPKIWEPSPA